MINLEQRSAREQANAFKLALLDFIETTAVYEQSVRGWDVLTLGVPRFTYPEPHLFYEAVMNSHATINSSIRAVGGLAARVELNGGPSQYVILDEWQGIDPADMTRHQWNAHDLSGRNSTRLSLSPATISEMRAELQSLEDVA
jgi:hypothetical protein